MPNEAFTAASIATALGCSTQKIRMRLKHLPANYVASTSGRYLVQAWAFNSLPSLLIEELEQKAISAGHKDAKALLLSEETNATILPEKISPKIKRDILRKPTLYMRSNSSKGVLRFPANPSQTKQFDTFQDAVVFCFGQGYNFVLLQAY